MKLDKEKFRNAEVIVNVKYDERKEFLKAVENEGIRWQDGSLATNPYFLPNSDIYIRFINDDIADISKFKMVYGRDLYNQLTVDDVTMKENDKVCDECRFSQQNNGMGVFCAEYFYKVGIHSEVKSYFCGPDTFEPILVPGMKVKIRKDASKLKVKNFPGYLDSFNGKVLTLKNKVEEYNRVHWEVEEENYKYAPEWFSVVDEENVEEIITKYRIIRYISPLLVLEKDPCKREFNKFVKKYDFYKIIEWTKEVEDYMMKQNGWIEWLIKNGFIELNIENIEYNEDKVYIINSKGKLYKLTGLNYYYMFASLDETHQGLNGYEDSPQKLLNECLIEGRLIYTYDNIYEAIKDHPPTKK